jgi:hypothetical protein
MSSGAKNPKVVAGCCAASLTERERRRHLAEAVTSQPASLEPLTDTRSTSNPSVRPAEASGSRTAESAWWIRAVRSLCAGSIGSRPRRERPRPADLLFLSTVQLLGWSRRGRSVRGGWFMWWHSGCRGCLARPGAASPGAPLHRVELSRGDLDRYQLSLIDLYEFHITALGALDVASGVSLRSPSRRGVLPATNQAAFCRCLAPLSLGAWVQSSSRLSKERGRPCGC